MRGRAVVLAILAVAISAAAAPRADWTEKLLARTDDVTKEVAKLRGLAPKRRIQRDLVDAAELKRRLVERTRRTRNAAQLAAEGRALARWGLVPRDADYAALVVDMLAEQIAGYYDPTDRTLYLARRPGTAPDVWAEMVLAHEIDHALQDQHFDLVKFTDVAATEGDALLARRALVEGDGVALMIEVFVAREGAPAPWGDPQVSATVQRALAVASGESRLARAPLALREQLLFPYHAGLEMVAALRRRRPWRAVDAAFARPPRSTEQVLHPDAYAADELPIAIGVAVPPALAGWDLAHHTVWGEAGVAVFLRQHGVAAGTAATAAAGWGGDRVALFARRGARGRDDVGVWRSVWDTDADAIEAEEAIVQAMDRWVVGTRIARGTPTRWLGLDGKVSWVERRDTELTVVVAAPAGIAARLTTEIAAAMPRR